MCVCACVRPTATSLWVVSFYQQFQHCSWNRADFEPRSQWRKAARKPQLCNLTVSAEPFAVRVRPQEDGLGTDSKSGAPSTDWHRLMTSSGPRMITITHLSRQLCIWCGSRHGSGPRLRSSGQPCECDFFKNLVCKWRQPPCPPRQVPQLRFLDRIGRANMEFESC